MPTQQEEELIERINKKVRRQEALERNSDDLQSQIDRYTARKVSVDEAVINLGMDIDTDLTTLKGL